MFDYNWWDDRTVEEYNSYSIHPCYGCLDFIDGECVSNGACGAERNGDTNVKDIN